MKTSKSSRFRTAIIAARLAAGMMIAAVASGALVACDDEKNPKTWVKRLDDPAKRADAIDHLTRLFEDDLTKANENRSDPTVTGLLDVIVLPMTKQYVSSTLDEKTREGLMRFLADTRDPRTSPALAKALGEYAPGKNEADAKDAADAVQALAKAQKLTDQTVKDALWSCYDKFQVSKTKLGALATALHDAVLAVSDPSYGPKAVTKLSAPVDPGNADDARDQLHFWQLTAVQLLGDVKFAPAAKPLVQILLSPAKKDLRGAALTSLLAIANDAEPVLIAALRGTDKDFAAAEASDTHKEYVAVIGDALSTLSRPAGRDAVLGALAAADNDTNRTVLAASLTKFPYDRRLVPAFVAAYAKLAPDASVELPHATSARGYLVRASASFYESSLIGWLLKEVATAKGNGASAMQSVALQAAIELMQPSQRVQVQAAVNKTGTSVEKEMFEVAAATLDKCVTDPFCYVKELDQPIASNAPTAASGAAKAAWMAAIYGNQATASQLAGTVDKLKNASARVDVVSAIDHLAPNGDAAVATQLDAIVSGDSASDNKDLLIADDAVARVAARLRARAQ